MIPDAARKETQYTDFDSFVDNLAQKQVVLWAGSHVNPQVVKNQIYVLKALHESAAKTGKKVNIGLEAFKAGDKEKKILSKLYNPETIFEALEMLSALYLPKNIIVPQDYVSTSFKESVSPFIDIALKCSMEIYPMAPVIEEKGQVPRKYWNAEVSRLILENLSDDAVLFSLNGRNHFSDPTYEKISIPVILSEKKNAQDIAVIVQSEVAECEPLIKQVYYFPCDCYELEGNLSR